MIESFALAVAFTALFGVTGVFHLRRWVVLSSAGTVAGQDRAVELGHLLMSLAMIGMVWVWGGSTARWLQTAVFGLLTVLFVARAAAVRSGGVGGYGGRAVWGYHALAMGAMAWMVAAMPLLGHGMAAGGSGHHHDGTATASASAAAPMGDAPVWAVSATVLLAGLLAVSTVVWAVVSSRTHAPASAPATLAAGVGAAGSAGSDRAVPDQGAGSNQAGSDEVIARPGHDRAAGWCHALMGVGMAGMLLLMV
ncbi:MAG TPA: DUF5134 domain-containing protein [Pseudonocardiaceae bacterium]|nr:DUF5134 domain-containing protein [Pseudonocardiaceae bacterium]